MINYNIFTDEWIKRAERNCKCLDEGDRFISLWIAFNGWMKNKFGETKNDSELIKDVKKCKDLEIVFKDLQKNNKIFKILLKNLRKYTILNMRYKSRPPKYFKGY